MSSSLKDSLVQLTPAGEPEVWDERIPAFNPLFFHQPEPSPVTVSTELRESDFDVAEYLTEEHGKDLLRFSTAGSVDDGKSTLIGRLLHDTRSVYDDHLQSIEGKGTTAPGVLDLALLTDGLRAEREQGITIDVAYRYFSTGRRKFIIADTPGHEQYTRNMATGASTADVAIVLVDARKGLLPQSRRHASITALLGVPHLIVAINKMDLAGYAEATFREIELAFSKFFAELAADAGRYTRLYFVPVSALAGDNVVHATNAMPWYEGPTLLALLESIPTSTAARSEPFRLAVQRVVRPHLDFRGFAGQIAAGTVRPGDRIVALPSGRSSRVERIVTFDGDLTEAFAPLSVTLTLEDEIDISRGDLLVAPEQPAVVTAAFSASLVWMDAASLDLSRRYLLKHTSRTVYAYVRSVVHTMEMTESQQATFPATLTMNGIGLVEIETVQPLAVDPYTANRHTGSFVLIDLETNATVAAGMIRRTAAAPAPLNRLPANRVQVEPSERIARFGHDGAHVHLYGPALFAQALERSLFDLGANVVIAAESSVPSLVEAGLLVVTVAETPPDRTGLWMTVKNRETHVAGGEDATYENAVAAALETLKTQSVLGREGEAV